MKKLSFFHTPFFDVQKGDLYFANRWKSAILEKISSFERVL